MSIDMFPLFEDWCDDVLHPEDTHPWNFRTQEFYDEYRTKYSIAKLIQPTSILEIGVRFGYSARSFLLAAPKASYVGLDMDEPSFGPFTGIPRLWANDRLCKLYPASRIKTHCINTQKDSIRELKLKNADLVHIDADHSFVGTNKDLKTFWPLTNIAMVVDDYEQIPEVKQAVEEFCQLPPDKLLLTAASLRGSAIIIRDN